MDKFVVKGPSKIKGIVSCSGSKNLALPLLAATLLFDKPVVLRNLPNVRDVQTMLSLLKISTFEDTKLSANLLIIIPKITGTVTTKNILNATPVVEIF